MGKLGSREMSATSDLDLIFVYDIPPGLESSDGRQPLPPTQYYTRLSAKIVTALTAPHQRGRALRGRHAAAPVGPRRAAGQFAGGLRELPCAVGLDVGAYGADPRAGDPRPGGAWPSGWRTSSGDALPAARSRGAGARRRRHARPHRPPHAGQEPVGLQASARRPVRHRLRRPVPGAAPRRRSARPARPAPRRDAAPHGDGRACWRRPTPNGWGRRARCCRTCRACCASP